MPVDPPEPGPEPTPSIPRLPGPPLVRDWRVLAAIAAALALAASISAILGLYWKGNIITAEKVMVVGPDELQGEFTVSTTRFDPRKITSKRTGGACLVADFNDVDIPKMGGNRFCSKNSDCNEKTLSDGSIEKLLPTGWGGYCDTQAQTCWVRPGSGKDWALCNKTPMYLGPPDFDPPPDGEPVYPSPGKRWDDGKYPSNLTKYKLTKPFNFPAGWGRPNYNGPSKWRVAAC